MDNYSLNLHPINGYLIVIILSIILTSISIYNENTDKQSLHKEKKDNAYLFVLRLVHYIAIIIANIYLFVFNSSYDILYLIYCITFYFHWIIMKFECFISYLEYCYYDENYKCGTAKIETIYLRKVFGKYTELLLIVLGIISVTSISIVLYRQELIPIVLKIIIIIILFLYMAYIYNNYHNKKVLLKKKI
jgi:hypothetical protein